MESESPKKRITAFDIISVVSAVGVIGWIVTDFFGGMILSLLVYGVIIIPMVCLYFISLSELILSLIRSNKQTSRIKLIAHGLVFISVIAFGTYHSEMLRSKQVMTALLEDDLYYYRLVFRENGGVESRVYGLFGFKETYYGKYKIDDNLIIFSKKPYDNGFLPDTLLLDVKQHAIFLHRNASGEFDTEKQWLNHFELENYQTQTLE